jgi:tetratricopeptide (TPR) repeat protein
MVHYRAIGNLYTQKFEFDEALKYMEIALKATGGDPSLEAAMSDTQRRKLDHQIETKKAEQATAPTDALKAEIEALEIAKSEFQIKDAERRRDRYPNDLDIRYDVGKLYFEAGRINDAIKEFQMAQRNPKIRLLALNYIGLCFMQKGILDLAADQFKKAIAEHPLLDNLKKDLYYNLGIALEKQKKWEEAIEQYKKIMEADFSYKDVAQKIEDYYVRKSNEGSSTSGASA